MAFNQRTLAVGRQVFFARSGDTLTPAQGGNTTVSAVAMPVWGSDPIILTVGRITDWEDDVKSTNAEDVWGPSPYALQLVDRIHTKPVMTIKFVTNQVDAPIIMEGLYRPSTNLTGATQQVQPLQGAPRSGWLHVQSGDQNNSQFATLDAWGQLLITGGVKSDGKIVMPTFEFTVFYSALNQLAIL